MRPGFALFCACLFLRCLTAAEQSPVPFNATIRPLLSDNCFACHGPDAESRKGKLRLDLREAAVERKAIVPGKPEESGLIQRIFTEEPDEVMPPADSHKVLNSEQKNLLKRWVAEGAVYEGHWAYIPPVKPKTPEGNSGIDYLVRERLKTHGVKPSPQADARTLIRRLYFDLAGLPPKPDEVAAFETDQSPGAYTQLVDRLLSSPEYGERMAIPWLDVVRFADTIGYHSDTPRNVWPYRDYVIRAFNENKPFDQFTVEQLAGDLLPRATTEQKVASAFNRLILSTEEGGAQPKDYEARMLTDRVRAVGTVWMGQTLGCAACHDHKFDPITQKDFYAMGAFFADISEPIIGRREDGMLVPSDKQAAELGALEKRISDAEKEYDGEHPALAEAYKNWQRTQLDALGQERSWIHLRPSESLSENGAKFEVQKQNSILVKGKKPEKDTYTLTFLEGSNPISALRLETIPHDSLPSKGAGRAGNGNFVISEIKADLKRADGMIEPVSFSSAEASFEQTSAAENNPGKRWAASAAIDGNTDQFGWAISPENKNAQRLVLELGVPLRFEKGDSLIVRIFQNHRLHTLGHFRLSATSSYDAARAPVRDVVSSDIAGSLKVSAEQRDVKQAEKLFAHFKSIAPEFDELRAKIASAKKAREDFLATIPRCLVSVSSDKPRMIRILPRGDFLNETGEVVQPALPQFLAGKSSSREKLTRLDLARWLVSKANPLTARVTVNRLWKQFFGVGLSKVLDDLGAQGEPPPNQALLDYLACEFMESGWDVKHMVRLIVTSDTYKQSSTAAPDLRARDPDNRLLAAQSRWRHEAELVRDNALAVSGLLVRKVGGPSAKPYQPDGYWENLNFPVRTYDASRDENQYRRGLYTWWQRSYMHPSFLAFDAPTREECVAERTRSNIPQQALVLLNDPSYVEASRAFAERILAEASGDTGARIAWAWREALARAATSEEIGSLQKLYEKHLTDYAADVTSAEMLLAVGIKDRNREHNVAELAAWTNVARVILNLHETITRG